VPLFVYRSSAGSGKTTALVNEYLKIAIQNPYEFKHILAITFTNKAAAEMKERILDALKQIINGNPVDNGAYTGLFKQAGISQDQFIERARQLQSLILHNYDDFAISTIDSFVHRIIRTFATDVKLPQNFEVVIDEEDFIPDIVAEIFDKVGTDEALTQVMVNFVMSKTEEEKSYNIAYPLNAFVKKQIGEEGFRHLQKIDHLTTADFVKLIAKLNKKRKAVSSAIKRAATNALELIHTNGLGREDFYQKRSGIYVYFKKCQSLLNDKDLDVNSYVRAAIDDDKWTAAKAEVSTINTIDAIKDELIDAFNLIQANTEAYHRLELIHKKIYALALAHEIRKVFLEFTDRTQKVHISEFNKRISQEIADQPIPFIYERLGKRFKYFLIDEFQDTSILQWQNLLPLIEESLAYGNFNMLVGDAKQAIYRFRNGEVELFVNLPKLYNNDGSHEMNNRESMLESQYNEVHLDKNWRSEKTLVQFNNEFFDVLKSNVSEHIQEIYSGHIQQLPDEKLNTGGFVSVGFIETENSGDYSGLRLERIKAQVEMLLASGYLQKDICVLTRTNRYAIEVAAFLLENNFNIVSSESLLLTNSPEVRLIVAFYRLLLNPKLSISLAEFVSNLVKVDGFKGDFHTVYSKSSAVFSTGLDAVFSVLSLPLISNEITDRPVYEIAEYLIRKLNLNQTPNIYLHYFLDFLFESQEAGKGTLNDFIEHWELKKAKLFITMPDDGDAIKVMTVHKAKGLKFEAVIADLISWGTRKNKDEYWTDLNEPGLEELKVGLLPITNQLEKIGLKEVVEKETGKTDLDFINLIYVAFTRAVSALFLTGNIPAKGKPETFTGYLLQYLKNKDLFEESKTEYNFGELPVKLSEPEKTESKEYKLNKIISSSWEDQLKIAEADDVFWEALDSKPARTYGKLIHAMLAKVRYADDIHKVIKAYQYSGIIDETESKEIEALMLSLVSHPELERDFKKGVLVKNEMDLFEYEQNTVSVERPDRVVIDGRRITIIDYKTGAKENKHKKQINQYAETISKLGYTNIDKKLVYLNDEVEVIAV